MLRSLPLAAFLAGLPLLAAADPLDRIAAANQAMAAQMEAFYLNRVPELDGKLPDYTWDAEMREAGACFVAGYEAARGADGLEAYILAMEDFSTVEITSFQQLSTGMPALLTEDLPLELTQSCGMVDISIQRAQASGFMEAMTDPSVLDRLMAE